MNLTGKTAVITGGGTGVGRATADFLAHKGCGLALLGRRAEKLESAREPIQSQTIPGVRIEIYPCDIVKENEVKSTFAKISSDFGPIDFLVNNAGVNTYNNLENISEAEISAEVDVKTKGIIYCTREAVLLMDKGGSIVNLTSVNAFLGGKSSPAYPAGNGAANTLTKYFAVKLSGSGIRVNAVAPGLIYPTGLTEDLPEETVKAMSKSNPMKRLCSPEDVAKAIYFLLSDLSAYINGHTLHVNGGYYMN